MDLRKLGLSYSDILFQAKVDPAFLSNVFGSMDFPVPKPSRNTATATATTTASAMTTATTTTTTTTTTTNPSEKGPIRSSSSGDTNDNITAKEPAQNTIEPPSRPKSATEISISQSQLPSRTPSRFGSDRWSQKLNIEVSDDDESDNESTAGSKQPSLNGGGSSRANAPLKERQRLEKEINDLMRKMEAQKAVKNQQRKAVDTSPSVTPPVADSRPSSSGVSTPVAPSQELRNKWNQALKRREEVRKRVSEYESKLNEYNVSNIEKEVDQLKRLLEEKMKAVMEAAYESASVRAQHEAAERENAAAENEVRELEQQMLEIERQQQQEQRQRQKEEEMHQKETVDENLHEECAVEEMEMDDQPLQPTDDVAMNDNDGSGGQDVAPEPSDVHASQEKPESERSQPTTSGAQEKMQGDAAKMKSNVSTATETVQVSATVQNNQHNAQSESTEKDHKDPSETDKEAKTVQVSTTFQNTEQTTQSESMQMDHQDLSETGEESRPIEIDSSQPEDEEMSEAHETVPVAKIKGEETAQGTTTVSSGKHIEVVDLLSDSESENAQLANETHHQEDAPSTVQPQAQENTATVNPQFEDAHSPEPPSKDDYADVAQKESNPPNEAEKSSSIENELEHPSKRKFQDLELVSSNRPTKSQYSC